MPTVTIDLRIVLAFVAGIAIAAVGVFALQASRADAIDDDESTFVAIQPCRLFDTRPAPDTVGTRTTPLGGNEAHNFQVTGVNGACSIPSNATAVSINLTGATASESTNLRAYPAGAPLPTIAVLNLSPDEVPTNNKVDVELSDTGQLALYNRFGTVHVIGDVLGYYVHDGLDDLDDRVTTLQVAQPFATTNVDNTIIITDTPQAVVSTSFVPPVDGQVTVNSTATVVEADAGDAIRCTITTLNSLNDGPFRQVWESPGPNGDRAQLAGTRVLDVTGGEVVTVNLICDHESPDAGADGAEITGSVLTAIFTPAQ